MDQSKKGLSLDELERLIPSGVILLKKKRYPTTRGLIAIMGLYGVESVETEMVEHDPGRPFCVHRAIVQGARGMFTATGDCSPENTSRMILPHYIRMSETRAIGRALRWYLGVGETVVDELADPFGKESQGLPRAWRNPDTLEDTGCTVAEVDGFLAWKSKPGLSAMEPEARVALIRWLKTEEGARALHAYHIRDLEGSK